MKLFNAYIKYTDGEELNIEVWLDIDSCIEHQIFMSFNPLDPDCPQIANFTLSEV